MSTLNQFHEELPLFLFRTFAPLCTHTSHLHKAKTGQWLKWGLCSWAAWFKSWLL